MNFVITIRARRLMQAALLLVFVVTKPSTANEIVRMQTDLGGVDIEIFDIATPETFDNFLFYVNGGLDGNGYDGTFIHRRAKIDDSGVSVLQMGGSVFNPANGTFTSNDGISHIPVRTKVIINEPGISNTRGTIAMARRAGDANSAGSEFFFNLVDNIVLDTIDEGFTVFGEVLGDGMEVIDKISALERCKDIGFNLPFPCSGFPQVPLVAIEAVDGAIFTTPVEQVNLVNILNIGTDTDGDGVIDRIEDSSPNNGDMNSDAVTDSLQENVVSFRTIAGDFIFLETPQGTSFLSTDVLGQTFAFTTIDPSDPDNGLAGLTILQGFFATQITGTLGSATTVTLTLPAGDNPDSFFRFAATPDNAVPHWHEFDFDGETGAQINGNIINLHYVDGGRGDADLKVNGKIVVSPGGAVRKPAAAGDADGIPDEVEDNAPNNGDGNGDGIADSTQSHVASLLDVRNSYLTVETDPLYILRSLVITDGTDFLFQADPPSLLNGLNFVYGFLSLQVANVDIGGNADVKLILPKDETPKKFFKYGPTPDNPVDHLYEFTFDGETGAEFNGNEITLHFVDGKRGDSDLTANGVITDPGTPALRAGNSGSGGGGGGCSLRNEGPLIGQAGAWWLLLGICCLYAGWRSARTHL